MGKKIAITGSSGYIGKMLIERLAGKDSVERIVAIDVAPPARLPEGIEFAQCDVRDADIARRFAGCDIVVHLAFIVAPIHDLEKTYDINVKGTRNVLAAAEKAGLEKLVVASSVAAYGRQPRDNKLINEDTPLLGDSESYYLHTKRIMEEDLDTFEKRNPGTLVTRLRPSILLGPKTANFARELMRSPVVPRVREGMTLPVVHEQDVIDAFELALDKDAPGPFIISLPEPMPIEYLAEITGKPVRNLTFAQLLRLSRIFYPLHLTRLSPDWVVAGQGNWRFDISRAREVLGWEPRHDLETTLRQMYEKSRRPWWKRMRK